MSSGLYRSPSTIQALHFEKAAYQRNLLLAWVILLLSTATGVTIWLAARPPASPTFVKSSGIMANAGRSPSHPYVGGRGESIGTSNSAGRLIPISPNFRIVRDSGPGADYPGPIVPASTPGVVHMPSAGLLGGSPGEGMGSGSGTGKGHGPGNADFGLPTQPLFARTLDDACWPGWGTDTIGARTGSPLVIEWERPLYPRRAASKAALVSVSLHVFADGRRAAEVIAVDVWTLFNGSVYDSVAGADEYGFGAAVLTALDGCIMWPAKDINGKNIGGYYLVIYNFCPECGWADERVISLHGNVIVHNRRL